MDKKQDDGLNRQIERYKQELLDAYKRAQPSQVVQSNQPQPVLPTQLNTSKTPIEDEQNAQTVERDPAPIQDIDTVPFPAAAENARTSQQNHDGILSQSDISNNHLQNGYLQVDVTIGRMALPITEVRCVVSKVLDGERHIFHDVLTDQNGKTAELPLPAPDKSISTEPRSDGILPYALYDLEVTKDGYERVIDVNIPIFDGILSVQNINLVPNAASPEESEPIVVDESYPNPL